MHIQPRLESARRVPLRECLDGLRRLRVVAALALSILGLPAAAHAQTVTMAWDANREPNIGGYILYYGTVPGQYSGSIPVGNRTQYTFTMPDPSRIYYFAVQAVNTGGLGGGLSSEVNSARTPLSDLVFDLGSRGLWSLTDRLAFRQISTSVAKSMTTGDLDGNRVDELIVDFGTGAGIWVRWNGVDWVRLHEISAIRMTAGDLDNNGRAELIVDFPAAGVYIFWNGTTWQPFHSLNTLRLMVVDINGGGGDLIIEYPGYGVWVRYNNGVWAQIHSLNTTLMAVGDFDGNGRGDIAMSFGVNGIWQFRNGWQWVQVTTAQPSKLAAGDVDGARGTELIAEFAPFGIWMMSNGGWTQLHSLNTANIATGDYDGNGRADVIADFGAGGGTWVWGTSVGWRQASSESARAIVTGNLN